MPDDFAPKISGLFGWIGTEGGAAPPGEALESMARGLGAGAGQGTADAHPAAGLQLVPVSSKSGYVKDGNLLAAIDGYPEWSHPDLEEKARERGHGIALLESYRRYGRDLLQYLGGPFAVAVLDPDRGRALIAIDRMGIHTMCFARPHGGALIFGSTTLAVTGHPSVTATVSLQAIYDYLVFYRVPAPRTIFEEQRKLLPAQYLWLDGDELSEGFYWEVPYSEDGPTDIGLLRDEMFDHLRGAIRGNLNEQDPDKVGTFLSGGLDSSTMTGLAHELSEGRTKAFTIGFGTKGYDEVDYARAAAAHFGVEHHIYTLTPEDTCEAVPRIAAAYDEPFGNSSAIPAYYCARFAREHGVETLIAGDGGDEIFAGNEIYVRMKALNAYHLLPRLLRKRLIEPIGDALSFANGVPVLGKAGRFVAKARYPMPERMFAEEPLFGTSVATIMADDVADAVDPCEPLKIVRDAYERARSTSMTQRMLHLDRQIVLADNDLRKVSRMGALAGVSVRYPLLSDVIVEFAAGIAPDLQIRGLNRRYFFRVAVSDYLPRKVLDKRKHGFGMPYGPWLSMPGLLRDLARDSLSSLSHRGLVKTGYIESVSCGLDAGASGAASAAWDLMMLEQWLQHHAG